jgi:hypothetical protein
MAEVMGHSSVQITLDRYSQIMPHLREALTVVPAPEGAGARRIHTTNKAKTTVNPMPPPNTRLWNT